MFVTSKTRYLLWHNWKSRYCRLKTSGQSWVRMYFCKCITILIYIKWGDKIMRWQYELASRAHRSAGRRPAFRSRCWSCELSRESDCLFAALLSAVRCAAVLYIGHRKLKKFHSLDPAWLSPSLRVFYFIGPIDYFPPRYAISVTIRFFDTCTLLYWMTCL